MLLWQISREEFCVESEGFNILDSLGYQSNIYKKAILRGDTVLLNVEARM